MGDIVKRWITEKLGLEVPRANDPPAFRVEVANGILIAEILRKYGLLSDDEFVSLSHTNTMKSRHTNMSHLHRWLTNAGMDIQQILLVDVAEEKSGSAVKLLYELFLWLENGARKPKVGDKAKNYLTTLKSSPVSWEDDKKDSPFKEYNRTSISSKAGRKSLREWDNSPEPSPLEIKPNKIIIKKSNWYSSLDKISAPAELSQRAPYFDLSESAQAEALYFSRESLAVLDRQRWLYDSVHHQIHATERADYFQAFKPSHHFEKGIRTVTNYHANAKLEEQKNSIEEIRKFDKHLKANRKKGQAAGKPKAAECDLIYYNGRGSPEQMKKSIQALKERRQKESNTLEKLAKCRKAAAHRIIEVVPSILQRELQDSVVKTVTRLPFSERMLADFIFNSHLEKRSFKQHACYEARQKQLANDFDLAKELQIAKQEDDLKKFVLENRTHQPSRRIEDEVDEELDEIFLEEKLAMVDDMLNNLVDVVVTIADYRAAMGNAAFGTEMFREAIDTGTGIQASVAFRDEKFVMEPKQDLDTCVHMALPPPATALFPTKDDSQFLVHHVAALLDRFLQIVNGSLIPMKAFTFIVEDLILSTKQSKLGEFTDSLPNAWLRLSAVEIKKLVYLLMGKRGYINWRNFLIACLNIRLPTQEEIISNLTQFRHVDAASLFRIDKNKYDTISFWFEPKPPCVLSDAFHALHLRECIFFMFADVHGYFYYIDFLLYFCKDPCPAIGLAKGLAVLTGNTYSTKGFETLYNDKSVVLHTDADLELMFEKASLHVEVRRDSLVPPNTPLPLQKDGQAPGVKGRKKGSLDEKEKGEDARGKKLKKRKSRYRGKSVVSDDAKSVTKSRKGVKLPEESSANTRTNKGSMEKKDDNINIMVQPQPSMEKQLGFKLPSQPDDRNHSRGSHPPPRATSEEEEEDYHSSHYPPRTFTPINPSEMNGVPSDAFLQALWFGHVTSYPVEDPSFVSTEYLKMKDFIDMVYTELLDNNLARIDNGLCTAQLQTLLEHPFVSEIIKRYITYKYMDINDILHDILSNASYDLDMDNMESPPSTASKDHLGKDEHLSDLDVDSAGEFDGNNTSLTSQPLGQTQGSAPITVSDGHRVLEVPQGETLSVNPPAGSISAPNAVSASIDARTPRAVRRTRSNLPAAAVSIG